MTIETLQGKRSQLNMQEIAFSCTREDKERNRHAVRAVQCAVRMVWCALFYEHTIFSFSHSGL